MPSVKTETTKTFLKDNFEIVHLYLCPFIQISAILKNFAKG